MHTLLLASSSPRRADLLKAAGYEFQILSIKVSEFLDKNLNLDVALMRIAEEKALAVLHSGKLLKELNYLVLSGDTVVCLDGEVLGKPVDEVQAYEYLSRLSARTHEVKTAISIYDTTLQKFVSHCETSKVSFKKLSVSEIQNYVATGEPMDKAGAYGLQGMARNFVRDVQGSQSNVVGLPMEAFERLIQKHGWQLNKK